MADSQHIEPMAQNSWAMKKSIASLSVFPPNCRVSGTWSYFSECPERWVPGHNLSCRLHGSCNSLNGHVEFTVRLPCMEGQDFVARGPYDACTCRSVSGRSFMDNVPVQRRIDLQGHPHTMDYRFRNTNFRSAFLGLF